MTEIEINGQTYKHGKLDARKAFHVARRLTPILAGMAKAVQAMESAAPEARNAVMLDCIAEDISMLSDETLDYVIDACMAVVSRKQADGRYMSVMTRGNLQFADMGMDELLQLTIAVSMESLDGFFGLLNGGDGSPTS